MLYTCADASQSQIDVISIVALCLRGSTFYATGLLRDDARADIVTYRCDVLHGCVNPQRVGRRPRAKAVRFEHSRRRAHSRTFARPPRSADSPLSQRERLGWRGRRSPTDVSTARPKRRFPFLSFFGLVADPDFERAFAAVVAIRGQAAQSSIQLLGGRGGGRGG